MVLAGGLWTLHAFQTAILGNFRPLPHNEYIQQCFNNIFFIKYMTVESEKVCFYYLAYTHFDGCRGM
jgi:hypothetical protein